MLALSDNKDYAHTTTHAKASKVYPRFLRKGGSLYANAAGGSLARLSIMRTFDKPQSFL